MGSILWSDQIVCSKPENKSIELVWDNFEKRLHYANATWTQEIFGFSHRRILKAPCLAYDLFKVQIHVGEAYAYLHKWYQMNLGICN